MSSTSYVPSPSAASWNRSIRENSTQAHAQTCLNSPIDQCPIMQGSWPSLRPSLRYIRFAASRPLRSTRAPQARTEAPTLRFPALHPLGVRTLAAFSEPTEVNWIFFASHAKVLQEADLRHQLAQRKHIHRVSRQVEIWEHTCVIKITESSLR